jgi:hypothetical protein
MGESKITGVTGNGNGPACSCEIGVSEGKIPEAWRSEQGGERLAQAGQNASQSVVHASFPGY